MSIATNFFLIHSPLERASSDFFKAVKNLGLVIQRITPDQLECWTKNIDETELLQKIVEIKCHSLNEVVIIMTGDRHDLPEIWRGQREKVAFEKKYRQRLVRWNLSWQKDEMFVEAIVDA